MKDMPSMISLLERIDESMMYSKPLFSDLYMSLNKISPSSTRIELTILPITHAPSFQRVLSPIRSYPSRIFSILTARSATLLGVCILVIESVVLVVHMFEP